MPFNPWLQEYSTHSVPNRYTNGQFVGQMTTPKPTRATTINSFWSEWSANKPTNLGKNEVDRHSAHTHDTHEMIRQTTPTTFVRTTTPELESWMLNILNEYSSTTTPRSQINQNNHEYRTTPKTVVEMPAWMHDVYNEYSTTTERKNIRFENDKIKQTPFGGGNGGSHTTSGWGGSNNGDLHRPKQNRYSMWIHALSV